MQSPAGYICMLLVVLEMISMPIVEKRLEKEKELRLKRIFVKPILTFEDVDILEKQLEKNGKYRSKCKYVKPIYSNDDVDIIEKQYEYVE